MSNIATEILRQLGGHMFLMMTGSQVETVTENSLRLKIGKGSKITKFEVILDPSDTYTVRFIKGRGLHCRVDKELSDVYAEDLVKLFEAESGFYAKL